MSTTPLGSHIPEAKTVSAIIVSRDLCNEKETGYVKRIGGAINLLKRITNAEIEHINHHGNNIRVTILLTLGEGFQMGLVKKGNPANNREPLRNMKFVLDIPKSLIGFEEEENECEAEDGVTIFPIPAKNK